MGTAITALGTANPLYKRAQLETAELIIASLDLKPSEKRLMRSVYKSTGIHYRHSVLSDYCKAPGEFEFFPNNPTDTFPTTKDRMKIYKENALNLAIEAINDCFAEKNCIQKAEITHLITVSCTGMYAPGIDIEIVQKLNLPSTIHRTTINFMGCYGAFNALKSAAAFCEANTTAKVLIVCVELCTIHFKNDFSLNNLFANAVFADGAAAAIIENKLQNKKCFSLESFYCDLIPQTSQEMAWSIANDGFDIVLSTYVPEAIEIGIKAFLDKFMQHQNMSSDIIDIYAIHPGGKKILEACELALGITRLDNQHSYHVLENFGNMSSVTVLFIFKRIWQMVDASFNNKNIFSCAFGPGLTLESSLLRICA